MNVKYFPVLWTIRLNSVIFAFHEADPEGMAGKFNNDNITDKVGNTENFIM